MPNPIATELELLRRKVTAFESFAQKYPLNLPGSIVSLIPNSVAICIRAGENRKAVLKACGDTFGRTGWRRERGDFAWQGVVWKKMLDGVRVEINQAEEITPDNLPYPVPVDAFPLVLSEEVGA